MLPSVLNKNWHLNCGPGRNLAYRIVKSTLFLVFSQMLLILIYPFPMSLGSNYEIIRVLTMANKSIHEKTIDLNKLETNYVDNIIHPSKGVYGGRKSKWEGILLRDLLTNAGINIQNQNEKITIVANDNYSSQIEVSDIRNYDIFLATKLNDKLIPQYKGGVHTIYPINNRNLPKLFNDSSFWVWSVNTIFMGDFQPTLKLVVSGHENIIDLSSLQGITLENRLRASPNGSQKDKILKYNVQASTIPILRLASQLNSNKPDKVKYTSINVHTYNKKNFTINKHMERYQVIFKWDGKNISPAYGGPIQICRSDIVADCMYYVEYVEFL